MNTYKIIPWRDLATYENLINSKSIEAESVRDAFIKFCDPNSERFLDSQGEGFVLHVETLNLYDVQYYCNLAGQVVVKIQDKGKLEKPVEKLKMNKYKLASKYSYLKDSTEIIEADNWTTAAINYCNAGNFVFGITNSCNIYVLNVETLIVYKVFLKKETTGKITTWSVEFKSEIEKPMIKPKPTNNLSFKTLAEANLKRLPLFKNSKGLPAHSKPDGSDWSHAEWLQAVVGELGEYANIMKKVQRGDLTMEEAMPSIEKEIADVQTYFSILALRLGIDLGQVTQDKFNEVSDKVKCDVYIQNDKVVSNYEVKSKQELRNELIEIKEKQKRINTNAKNNFLKAEGYHKPMSFNSAQIANLVVGAMAGYLMNPCYYYYKPQMTISLRDLGNGKVYSKTKECEKRTFSMLGPPHLKEMGSEIVEGTLTKILLNGKEYEPKNVVKVGDLIQFSDERNILYSLRITELIVS